MHYAELFAGAGGLSLGLERAGMQCVAHAEIEPHARAVLRRGWSDTPLHGDVTAVDWSQYAGEVDLVSGGSPCQDLSVAGKRAGLEGERSGLFYELIRAWNESAAPYCLWENVDGARSSNGGADFASVLSAFVGATIPVPADGWQSAGVAAGATGVAAWRVLDLQHFGPPQRRRRVFVLAARAGGVDPAEVLAVSESLCGHTAPREREREGAAGRLSARTRGGGGLGTDFECQVGIVAAIPLQEIGKRTGVSTTDVRAGIGIGAEGDAMYTLQAGAQHGVLAFDTTQITSPANYSSPTFGDPCHPLAAGAHPPTVIAFHLKQNPISGPVSPSFGRTTEGMGVVAFSENQRAEVLISDVTRQLTTGGGKPGQGYPAVLCATGPVTHALTHEGADASEDGTGRGTPIVVTPTLNMGAHTAAPGSNGQDAAEWAAITVPMHGRPRRLTPLECERLQSWPDHWTATGVREDGSEYALSDTARYRLCGNGVGSVVAEWIGRRLMWAEAHAEVADA